MMNSNDYNFILNNIIEKSEDELWEEIIKRDISNLLNHYGVPAYFKGYDFLCEAIIIAVSNRDNLCGITKYIYPEVARRYNTTINCVDSNMRHAITTAWEIGNLSNFNGFEIKPTNSLFVFTIAKNIK